MRAADFVTASVLMLLGGIVLFDAVRLGIGWGTDGPKSGFFPFWLALIMVVTCGIIILKTLWRSSREAFVTREQLGPVLQVFWPAAARVFLTHFVGLYVGSPLYIGFYMRCVRRHAALAVAGVSVVIPGLRFLVFDAWVLVAM